MKYLLIGVFALILAFGAFAYKSNQEDKERLKQAEISHQQKLEKEKLEASSVKNPSAEKNDHKEVKSTTSSELTQASSTQTSNDTGSNKYSEEEWFSICKSTAGAAKAIMNSRQRGVSMTEMMDKVVGTAEPAIKDVVKAFVIAAYEKPRFNTSEYQQKAEIDFENEAYLVCIKARS